LKARTLISFYLTNNNDFMLLNLI